MSEGALKIRKSRDLLWSSLGACWGVSGSGVSSWALGVWNVLSAGPCKLINGALLAKLFFSRFCHAVLKEHNWTTRQSFHQLARKKPCLPSAVWHSTGNYRLKINSCCIPSFMSCGNTERLLLAPKSGCGTFPGWFLTGIRSLGRSCAWLTMCWVIHVFFWVIQLPRLTRGFISAKY